LEQAIQEMVEQFDWIIIDSPPILNIADPMRLAPLCDTVLMVVRASETPVKMIQKSVQILGKNLICGIVMNRMQTSTASRYYYHYYSVNEKK